MVLWLENRCHRIETWWSCSSQGRHFSRKEEDQGQTGGQVSWGSTSDHDRHPLAQSERPAWNFTHPTSQPAPPCCIRSWCSLACGHLPCMGWMFQSHPSQAYSQGEWKQDNGTRRWWSDYHIVSGWEDNPWGGLVGSYDLSHGCQLECQLKMGEISRQCFVGMDIFIDNGQQDHMHLVEGWTSIHRYHWIVDCMTTMTTHRTRTQ